MSLPQGQRATEIGAAVANAVREHSAFFLAEGIILVLLGALAIFLPLFATITITIILGWIFLVSGIVGLITTFGARKAPGFWWSLSIRTDRYRCESRPAGRTDRRSAIAHNGA